MSAAAAADCGGWGGGGCCCCCSIFARSSARIISSEAEGDIEADEAEDTAASRGEVAAEGARPCCFRSLKDGT